MKIGFHIFFILCLIGLSSCVVENTSPPVELIKVGNVVPVFSVLDSDGATVDFTAANFTGKKTLIVFFFTTCWDCQRELPKVQAAWKALAGEGLQLITISREQDVETVREYWNNTDDGKEVFDMPWYVDSDRSAYSKFATSTVPRLYLVDKSGVVIWKAVEDLRKLGINTGNQLIAKINEFN